jgi:hypothetical protein
MKLAELARKSREAAQVRAYQTHPDVAALRIERVRVWSAGLIWSGVVLGLAFTMTNVQQFAAHGAATGSLSWLSAWLLDPMVSLVLIGVLLAEQVTARWELDTPVWARRTKWFALAATYVMNTWQPWATLSSSGIVLHSVPPLLVFTAVEGGPAIRETLTKAVARSLAAAAVPATPVAEAATGTTATDDTSHQAVNSDTPTAEPVHEPPVPAVHEHRTPPRRTTTRKPTRRPTGRRKLRADFLADARAAWTPDTHLSPAWVREVTDCSRGMSSQIAADLKAELDTTTPVSGLHAVNSEEVA